MFQWFLPLTSRMLNAALLFCWVQNPGFLWKRDLSMSLIWPRSCWVWDLCKEPHGCCSVPQTEHLDFHSSLVRHCKASWISGIVIGREKSRMDVDVEPAGRSRQLLGLLLSYFMVVHCTPGKISSGIQAIKRVVKLKQKLLAKSSVPGRGRRQVGTTRTGSEQL